MGTDDVFFGTSGIVTAYAASKNDGFVDISYVLYDSGLDSDNLAFSPDSISSISDIGPGTSRYNIIPSDADNGVITITATFYHRGILITPVCGHAFDDHDCGGIFDEYFSLSITQLGNAPTGQITLNISGTDSDVFYLSAYNIPSIDIDDSVIIDAGIRSDSVPTGYYYNIYTAQIDVSGDYLNAHTAPVSVRIAHSYSPLIYRGGFHNQYCTGCNLYRSGLCIYSLWSVLAGTHRRSCSICFGVDSHMPAWSPWSPLNSAEHLRTCTLCNIHETAPHNDLSFPATWTNADAANHSRERRCTVCNRFMRTELQAHTWGNWSAWTHGDANNHHRTGSCTTPGCGRPAIVGSTTGTFEAHNWGSWSIWSHDENVHSRTRSCSICSRPDSESYAHTWGDWYSINATQHRRTCSVCSRPDTQSCHFAGVAPVSLYWGVAMDGHGNAFHVHSHRRCTTCYAHPPNPGAAVKYAGGAYCVFNSANICVASSFPGSDITEWNGCGVSFALVPGNVVHNLRTP
jgi:hypothetical protein